MSYDDGELTTGSVLKRDIPFETYHTARLISEQDLKTIREFVKKPRDAQEDLLQRNGAKYVEAFLTILRNVTKEETVQYALAVLDDVVTEDPSRIVLFHATADLLPGSQPEPYSLFSRLLARLDWFTQDKACRLLALTLQARPSKGTGEEASLNGDAGPSGAHAEAAPAPVAESGAIQGVLSSFLDWLCAQLRRPSHPSRSVPSALAALALLLREAPARALFTRASGVSLLAPLLRTGSAATPPSPQLLYNAALCVWQLTFWPPAARQMGPARVVPGLVDLVKAATKEKVVRMAVFALRNLLCDPALDLGASMVDLGLPKAVAQRKLQNFEDPDIPEGLTVLGERLAASIKALSSWEVYRREVLAGTLEWTPMHTSDAFWAECHAHFEEKDFQALRVLLKLLETSRDEKTLAVGTYDLGRFVLAHPHGRNIVADLRGKELVLRLLMHPNPEVQKQALLTTQKLMLHKDKLGFLSEGVAAA